MCPIQTKRDNEDRKRRYQFASGVNGSSERVVELFGAEVSRVLRVVFSLRHVKCYAVCFVLYVPKF